MPSGSTRSGWSWLHALTALCSSTLSGKISLVIRLDIGFTPVAGCVGFPACECFVLSPGRDRLQTHDSPALNSQNEVTMLQRAYAMRNDERGATLHEPFHCFHNGGFGLDIHGTGRFVEDENGRVLQEGAR